MKWLARLKTSIALDAVPTKPTKTGYVGFIGSIPATLQKTGGEPAAANDPAPDHDRWAWSHSEAMNTLEIDTFTARLARYTDKGLSLEDAERQADRLVKRDREQDDRRLCLECAHLHSAGHWHCGNSQLAGEAINERDTALPDELVKQLQRCDGFREQIT